MSIEIGQTLLKQLQALRAPSPVNRDEYFDEECNKWNVERLEEDLRLQKRQSKQHDEDRAQSMMTSGNSSVSSSDTTTSDAPVPTTPSTMATAGIRQNAECEGIVAMKQPATKCVVTVHAIKQAPSGEGDRGSRRPLAEQQRARAVHPPSEDVHRADTANPAQMPSPNASPSIEYNNDAESDQEARFESTGMHPQPQMVSLQSMNTVAASGHGEGQRVAGNERNDRRLTSGSNVAQNAHSTHSVSRSVHSNQQRAVSLGAVSQNTAGFSSRKSKSDSRSSSPSSKKSRGRKRKNSDIAGGSTVGGSPPTKRLRATRGSGTGNEWNDLALKKLHSLKRQVKNSSWFWEPVHEVRHSAQYYPLVCPLPSDYGTICSKLEQREYGDLDAFLRDCELVFINARMYNTTIHAVHLASLKLEKKFKELLNPLVEKYHQRHGSAKTMVYWGRARRNYQPFAVPIDD